MPHRKVFMLFLLTCCSYAVQHYAIFVQTALHWKKYFQLVKYLNALELVFDREVQVIMYNL